jgi:hypothetical protein
MIPSRLAPFLLNTIQYLLVILCCNVYGGSALALGNNETSLLSGELSGVPGGPPCIPLAESRFCGQWAAFQISGNLRSYFVNNPGHGVASIPVVSTVDDFDTAIMEGILLAEPSRKQFYQTLTGCDLQGRSVRFMTSYFCASLIAYSTGCMDLQTETTPLCRDSCDAYVDNLQSLLRNPKLCDAGTVKQVLSGGDNESNLDGDSIQLESSKFCGMRMLSGKRNCISGSTESFCGFLTSEEACSEMACPTEDCPNQAIGRKDNGNVPNVSGRKTGNLQDSLWSTSPKTIGIAIGIGVGSCIGAAIFVVYMRKCYIRRQVDNSASNNSSESRGTRPLALTLPVTSPATRQASTSSDSSITLAQDELPPPALLKMDDQVKTFDAPLRRFSRRRAHRPPNLFIPVTQMNQELATPIGSSSTPVLTPPIGYGSPEILAHLVPNSSTLPREPHHTSILSYGGWSPMDSPRNLCDSFHSEPFRNSVQCIHPPPPATVSAPNISTLRARMAYRSSGDDELSVDVGDLLLVLEVYEDGWCHVSALS